MEWNGKKRDAQLARTLELALPAELTHDQNIALICKFVQKTFVNKVMSADVAFHDKDDGNPHVHIMLIIRASRRMAVGLQRADWSTMRFLLDYEPCEQKEAVRRLEVVKREFIKENERKRPERYER